MIGTGTAWYKDNEGAIIKISKDSTAMDVSFDYTNLLNTTEAITSATFTTPSEIEQLGDFASNGGVVTDKKYLAVLLASFRNIGTHLCSVSITTSEGRVFKNKFKIKVI